MRKMSICFLVPLLLIALSVSANASRRITSYTTWDDYFFYAAFEVPDTNIQSTNLDHMSKPWEDDSVEVFLDRDLARADSRTPNTYEMAVSAGGGSSWLVGDGGKPVPKKIFTFKYSSKIEGTLNKPDDRDMGYVIEIAMPWQEMGGPPKPGATMGFNFICRLKGENDTFVSFSPDVTTEDDIQNPSKWGQIRFVDNPTVIAIDNGAIVSRKVFNRSPVVDGKMSPSEWNRDLSINTALPEAAKTVEQAKQSLGIEKLLMAKYYYGYAADGQPSTGNLHRADSYTDHPFEGLGPWMSYNSVQWHKDQLTAMAANGIDVVLPVFYADAESRKLFASDGLAALAQAMRGLKADGKSVPLAGLYLDADSLSSRFAGNADANNDEVSRTFYSAIKDFFLHIPAEFRAEIQTPAEKGGHSACIVALSGSSKLTSIDPAVIDYCNTQFAKDFGRKLIWLGDQQYKGTQPSFDGYMGDASKPASAYYDESGWIKVAQISPVDAEREKRDPMGDSYKHAWEQIITKSPDWIIIDSWNNFAAATEVCPSREYGYVYSDTTKLQALSFNGMRPYSAKFLRHDTPAVMLPGAMYQVTINLKNAGLKPWYPGDGIFLAGRWYKDGSLYADSGARLPIQEKGLAGSIICKTIGIRTIDQDGQPLPEGDYDLRWEMMRGRDEWFADQGSLPLVVPVKIGTPIPGFTLVSADAPVYMKPGVDYKTTVRVRNDGPTTWAKGSNASVDCWRIRAYNPDISQDTPSASSITPLTEDVEPGRIVEISLPVKFTSASNEESDVLYGMIWTVPDPGGDRSSFLNCSDFQPVSTAGGDDGQKFVSQDIPREMRGGRKFPVSITLRNAGAEVWMKSSAVVTYRWFGLDGIPVQDLAGSLSLPHDIQPGEEVSLKATVTAPSYDGRYNIVWDVNTTGKEITSPASVGRGDLLIFPVQIIKGKTAGASK